MSTTGGVMSKWSELGQRILASYSLPQLRRIRWSVILVMVVAVLASVAANILHAQPNWISRAFAAWPPLAFLLVVDVISRIPATRPLVSFGRILSALVVTGIAGLISYGHMRASAEEYGETGYSAVLLPISVDGLIVVCSLSLIELGTAIRLKLAGITVIEPTGPAQPTTPAVITPPAPAVAAVEMPQPAPQTLTSERPAVAVVDAPPPDPAPSAATVPTEAELEALVNSLDEPAPAVAEANGHTPPAAESSRRSAPAKAVRGEVKASVPRRSTAGTRYGKATDEQRIARLREMARDSLNGRVSAREAARELGIGREAAGRLLQMAGLDGDSEQR